MFLPSLRLGFGLPTLPSVLPLAASCTRRPALPLRALAGFGSDEVGQDALGDALSNAVAIGGSCQLACLFRVGEKPYLYQCGRAINRSKYGESSSLNTAVWSPCLGQHALLDQSPEDGVCGIVLVASIAPVVRFA